jgi:hypothetical protein
MTATTTSQSPTLRLIFALGFVLASASISGTALAQTASLTLGWYESTSSNIAGYKIHLGTRSGEYSTHYNLGLPIATDGIIRVTIPLDQGSNYFISISTYDSGGSQSPFSDEVLITAQQLDPTGKWTTPGGDSSASSYQIAESTAYQVLTGIRADSDARDVMIDMPEAFGLSREMAHYVRFGSEVTVCDFEGDGIKDVLLGNVLGSKSWKNYGAYAAQFRAYSHHNTTDYTAYGGQAGGLLRPIGFIDSHAICADVDSDGRQELIISTGRGGENKIQILDDVSTAFGSFSFSGSKNGTMQVAADILAGGGDGHIRTAAGDIDGDGFNEIVVTFAAPFADQVLILDDINHAFEPMVSNYLDKGFIIHEYDPGTANFKGNVVPMIVDSDNDGISEIVVIYGATDSMSLMIFDDATAAFLRTH